MYLDPRGAVRACCQNVWHTLGNVSDGGLQALWRGERMARLRAAVAEQDLTLGCERCAVHTDRGHPEAAYARVFDWLGADEETDWPLQLELALTNACNLQCVMCNGELSSAIRIHREGRSPLPVVYDEAFFAELDLFLPHLHSVVFLGGEPFLGREPLRVMERLMELGLRPNCSITTNGTIWNDRVGRLLTGLPMHVTLSIDGASAETFEAIRAGASHRNVLENLERFQTATEESGGTVSVSFCLMRNNWHELGSLLLWADGVGVSVFVNSVTHPPQMSLVHATAGELAEVLGALEAQDGEMQACLERNRGVWNREIGVLRRLVTERREETAVRLRGSADGGGRATVVADRVQIVEKVYGEAQAWGLDLESLVGQSIWEVQQHLSDVLGELVASSMSRHGDGSEDFHLRFKRDGGSTTVAATLHPHLDGGQTWEFTFRQDDANDAQPLV